MKKTELLNGNRKMIYEYLVEFIEKNGYSPSLSEIMTGVGCSSRSIVKNTMQQLVKMGLISYKPKLNRTITLNDYRWVKVEKSRIENNRVGCYGGYKQRSQSPHT